MPLVSFCNRVSLEHAPGLPVFRRSEAASCVSNERLSPCGPTGRTFSGQGSLGSHRVDPRQDDRSPWWIYPNLTGPGTPCRSPVPSLVWKKQGSATLRYGSLFERTSLARQDSLGLPCRAAIRSLSRKKATNNRTRGTFSLGVGNGFRRTAEPSGRAMTRLAHDHQRLFGLTLAAARPGRKRRPARPPMLAGPT